MRPDRPTLVFDGTCGFCRDTVRLVARWDRAGRLVLVPFQDAGQVAALGLAPPAVAAALHLVLPDGRVFAGADAVAELLRLLPGLGWAARAFAIPGVRPVARRVYAWVARRRHCLVATARSTPKGDSR
jgi:predicted DCC family thiol-disulfide oxidoreductase YuxK